MNTNDTTTITVSDVAAAIRNVHDFPVPGILFKDITTAIKRPEIFRFMLHTTYEKYKDLGITKVAGIESRGFILGGALAAKLNAGFVPIRKPGKLPAPTFSKSYSLEYGQNILHIHQDALNQNDVVLLHDDLLATGGSAKAAIALIEQFNVKKIYVNFICELAFLHGINQIKKNCEVFSLVTF